MTKVNPVTIDDIIEKLTKLKDEFGNLEVRRFEGRYKQEPNFDTYPTFSILPADRGNQKIVVVLWEVHASIVISLQGLKILACAKAATS